MSAYEPRDVAWDVAQAMAADPDMVAAGIGVGATMVPYDLEDRLPFVVVQVLGGVVTDRVVDAARINIDTWAATPSEATRAALTAFGAAMRLSDRGDAFRGDTTVYARPYPITDDAHPTLAHVRALVGVTTVTER